jgi:hypothetical protein
MIPDFTDTELWIIQSTVDERWGKGVVELHLADVEMKLGLENATLSNCPAVFWVNGECNFVVTKTGEQRYRCQFFYNKDLEQQLSTGIKEYDDIATCIVTLLQAQADYESVRTGTFPGDAP